MGKIFRIFLLIIFISIGKAACSQNFAYYGGFTKESKKEIIELTGFQNLEDSLMAGYKGSEDSFYSTPFYWGIAYADGSISLYLFTPDQFKKYSDDFRICELEDFINKCREYTMVDPAEREANVLFNLSKKYKQ